MLIIDEDMKKEEFREKKCCVLTSMRTLLRINNTCSSYTIKRKNYFRFVL
jgi:hypothetical protein